MANGKLQPLVPPTVLKTDFQERHHNSMIRLMLLVGLVVTFLLVSLMLVRVFLLPPGRYELIFTNATDRVVSEAIIGIRNSKQVISNLAPQAATTLVFMASSDTCYSIDFRVEGQESVHTNVGYLCRGMNAKEEIVVHENSTLSFSSKHYSSGHSGPLAK